MTVLVDIVGINVPDPPRTINLEILGDFLGTISKVTIAVRSGVCKKGGGRTNDADKLNESDLRSAEGGLSDVCVEERWKGEKSTMGETTCRWEEGSIYAAPWLPARASDAAAPSTAR